MTKKQIRLKGIKAREDFRRWLTDYTECEIQTGRINNRKTDGGWPCGTCVMALLTAMGLDMKDLAYSEKNDGHDRHNEVWRFILQMRDKKL